MNYADDFVILSRGHATEALAWTRHVMTRLGLSLNEAKTSVRDGRKESFDFLGYSFGPHRYRKDGHWYLGASPSKTSVARLKPKVRGQLAARQPSTLARGARPAEQRTARLVAILRIWDAHAGLSSGRQLRL